MRFGYVAVSHVQIIVIGGFLKKCDVRRMHPRLCSIETFRSKEQIGLLQHCIISCEYSPIYCMCVS